MVEFCVSFRVSLVYTGVIRELYWSCTYVYTGVIFSLDWIYNQSYTGVNQRWARFISSLDQRYNQFMLVLNPELPGVISRLDRILLVYVSIQLILPLALSDEIQLNTLIYIEFQPTLRLETLASM